MLWDNIVYILFILAFTTIMAFYVYAQQDASAVWADYYAKEIVKVVDTSQPGEAITLDVHRTDKTGKIYIHLYKWVGFGWKLLEYQDANTKI